MLKNTKTKIICDFDGTITSVDAVDAILEEFASPEWLVAEQLWLEGKITSLECTSKQVPMIRATRQEFDDFIDRIPITAGFKEFALFCISNGLNLCIASDGIDYVINRILTNLGLASIPVMANHLIFTDDGYALSYPRAKEGCKYGMCKCSVADAQNNRIVLIGDSRSDTCLANHAAAIYARRGFPLEKYCRKNKLACTPYDDFFNILESVNLYGI